MRIYNYRKGTARRIAVEDDKVLVDPIDAPDFDGWDGFWLISGPEICAKTMT